MRFARCTWASVTGARIRLMIRQGRSFSSTDRSRIMIFMISDRISLLSIQSTQVKPYGRPATSARRTDSMATAQALGALKPTLFHQDIPSFGLGSCAGWGESMPWQTGHTVGVGSSMGVISPASASFAMIIQPCHPYLSIYYGFCTDSHCLIHISLSI